MKKIFYITILCSALTCAHAQTKFGANIGMLGSYSRIENLFSSNANSPTKNGYKFGFKIGGFAEFKINKNWTAVSGINFLYKGATYSYDSTMQNGRESLIKHIKTNYIETEPITVIYAPKVLKGFFVGAGPVIGIGIGGKTKVRYPGTLLAKDASPEKKIHFEGKKHGTNLNDSIYSLRPLEIGAALTLGYEFKRSRISVLLSFYQSFSNISSNDKGTYRNQYFMLGSRFKF